MKRVTCVRWCLCLLVGVSAACGGGSSEADDDDQNMGEPAGPHATGGITLSETHRSSGGTSASTVSAGFLPDSALESPRCVQEVAGCEIQLTPDCGTTCGAHEYCTWTASCQPACKRACDASCGPNEECYFPTPATTACRAIQSFDAGSITLSGTTTPVTLFPPYAFDGLDNGTLFTDRAILTATAAGAANAGYTGFTESFTATNVVRTNPPLHQLTVGQVFGTGDLPIRWVAADDKIEITASVLGIANSSSTFAIVTCEADDAKGAFDLPRQAIDAALDGSALYSMSIAVTRSSRRTIFDVATKGAIAGVEIQPTGWLELATMSTESAELEGCSGGEQVCGNACVDLDSDKQNCGACGHACAGNDYCYYGTCTGANACDSCLDATSDPGEVCGSCRANAGCNALMNCFAGCSTQACSDQCWDTYASSASLYQQWVDCVCDDHCAVECESACS
ncbi:MAG: hypothetical protein AB7L28_08605 [Kofleriaceae bacterium]